jgi:hypothetical protein
MGAGCRGETGTELVLCPSLDVSERRGLVPFAALHAFLEGLALPAQKLPSPLPFRSFGNNPQPITNYALPISKVPVTR